MNVKEIQAWSKDDMIQVDTTRTKQGVSIALKNSRGDFLPEEVWLLKSNVKELINVLQNVYDQMG